LVVSPLYVVSEYGIRRPLGFLIAGAERARVPEALFSLFFLTHDRKVGWVPTFLVDFGFKPSAGLFFFWNDAFARGNDLRLHAATWGSNWLAGSITDRVHLSSKDSWTLKLSGIRRPDYRYYGEGPATVEEDASFFASDRLEVQSTFRFEIGDMSELSLGAGVRSVDFGEPSSERDESTPARVAQGRFAEPEAFDTGYTAGYSQALLRLDSRRSKSLDGSGLRLDVQAEQGSAPNSGPRGWLRYGATAGAFLDLNAHARVLSLSLTTQFADPLGSNGVPFTELVSLGGSEAMRGFVEGRLVGRSSAVATLGYSWPVWVWLNGSMQAAVGNVFGPHLEQLEASLLRFSGAIGVETAGFSDNPVEILLGFGTETFDSGARMNSLRLVFGTSRGF
jgi:hypothetical protein